jgi:hypothetical protein
VAVAQIEKQKKSIENSIKNLETILAFQPEIENIYHDFDKTSKRRYTLFPYGGGVVPMISHLMCLFDTSE